MIKTLPEILAAIDQAVEKFETTKLSFTHDQSEILRDLSTNVHFLTSYRIAYHERWMQCYFASNATSSAAKEREADAQIPELYKIRHFVTSANKVMDALRTTISANK